MAREAADWVRFRRHPKGGGVYVYIPQSILERAGLTHYTVELYARRYVMAKGDILVRFRELDQAAAQRHGWAFSTPKALSDVEARRVFEASNSGPFPAHCLAPEHGHQSPCPACGFEG